MSKTILPLFILLLLSLPAFAVEPDEMLPDPALEARARAITKDLRCLVCQGQSIDDSAAPLAADLRKLVRAHLRDGASDDEIRDFLRQRYGDTVLLDPPVRRTTLLLWVTPAAVLLLGLAAAILFIRRQNRDGGEA